MALISCPECGREISDRATACPHCGCPVSAMPARTAASVNGVLHLNWADRKGHSLRKTTVRIDGTEYGTMQNADFLDVPLSGGMHRLELYQGKHLLLSEEIEISAEHPEEYVAYKEAMGFSHAQLKRVEGNFARRSVQSVPRCPTCGSEKIKKLSATKKALSFEMLGFASGSIGKTFECKNCGYKW